MRGRRRRRTRYTWLPILGGAPSNPGTENTAQYSTYNTFAVDYSAITTDVIAVGVQPIVINARPDQWAEHEFPLNDVIGDEYFIKRIVGKAVVRNFWINGAAQIPVQSIPSVQVGVGLLVARIDPNDVFGSYAQPVDFNAQGSYLYNPLNAGNAREPWIWRRTWTLGVDGAATGQFAGDPSHAGANGIYNGFYPGTNTAYGSVLDGPHVDAKTARRVRQDEGLFIALAASPVTRSAAVEAVLGNGANVALTYDLRVLGSLRKARDKGSF